MMQFKQILLPFAACLLLFSCQSNNDNRGTSTPIDSTNDQGTAPAVYGGDNPANDQDTNYQNSSDTGTRINEDPDNTNNNTQNR